VLETKRLSLRKPRPADAADLAVAYGDPEVVRYISGHWGRGYATEATLALRDWALGERRLTRLISLIQHENVRSFRVAERLGEQYERDVEVRGKLSRLYAVER
jgi:RimJ/RimL family protein N-acetyltransferase